MTAWSGGKGSNPRPVKNQQQFEQNWDAIFGKKDKPKTKPKPKPEDKRD